MSEKFVMFGWDIGLVISSLNTHRCALKNMANLDSRVNAAVTSRLLQLDRLISYLLSMYEKIYSKPFQESLDDTVCMEVDV